ncbi:MAG: DUF695 domain-containing protein [Chloroflexota bacterium]
MFKKKYPSIEELVIKEEWGLSQGTYQDKAIFIRANKGLKKIARHPQYPHQVGVAVPLNNPNEHGLPISAEGEQLNEIEDQLVDALEVKNESVFVGAISTNGMREFVFYTSDPEQVIEKINAVQEKTETHKIQLIIQEDKDWLTYKTMVE